MTKEEYEFILGVMKLVVHHSCIGFDDGELKFFKYTLKFTTIIVNDVEMTAFEIWDTDFIYWRVVPRDEAIVAFKEWYKEYK